MRERLMRFSTRPNRLRRCATAVALATAATAATLCGPALAGAADYDGDGPADFAIWRPSDGNWWILGSARGEQLPVRQWGASSDKPAPGDYDGDGRTDVAIWRPSDGTWWVLGSARGEQLPVPQLGASGDRPVPGDYDGDRRTDFAVWRPSTGMWYVIRSSNGEQVTQWGATGDEPIFDTGLPPAPITGGLSPAPAAGER